MSESEFLPPELSEIEASLASLAPVQAIDRDRLMFQLGAQAHRCPSWQWPALSAVLAVALLGVSLDWMRVTRDNRQLVASAATAQRALPDKKAVPAPSVPGPVVPGSVVPASAPPHRALSARERAVLAWSDQSLSLPQLVTPWLGRGRSTDVEIQFALAPSVPDDAQESAPAETETPSLNLWRQLDDLLPERTDSLF
jgi:hypothetical protein